MVDCPYCKGSYAIIAVKFGILRGTTLVLACTSCGSAEVEAPSVSKDWPKLVPRRFGVAVGFMMTASIALYLTIRILAS